MSTSPSQDNSQLTKIDRDIQEVIDHYRIQINQAVQELAKLDDQIANRKRGLRFLRDRLAGEIEGLKEEDEDIKAAKAWIEIADVFLDAPSEHMEMAIAREYLKIGPDEVLDAMKQLLSGTGETDASDTPQISE